ncbi:MAG: ABC transporter permease subunit [Spirochaetaceae bacterium]
MPALVFPSLTEIVYVLYSDIVSGVLIKAVLFSLLVIICAFIPSMFLGFVMAFLSYRFKSVDKVTEKLSSIAHPLPGIALLPLLIIWTGLGIHVIVLIVIHSVLWPFYVNIRSGFNQVPQLWIDLGRNNRINKRDEFLHILLPAAFPSILSGLKIAWARAWRAVISAEMIYGTIGGAGGLGWFIYNKRIFMDTPGLYGGIFLLMIIGLLVEKVFFSKLERKTNLYWGDSNGSN